MWLLIDLVERMDTSAFHVDRRTGGAGRAGYDPDMLVTLVVWGWLQGVRSSRRIERSCGRDVGFRVICAGDVPDHVTIARFVKGFADAVESLMVEVLLICRRLGLAQLGVVALDGTKMATAASTEANRSEEGLRRAQAADEVPPVPRTLGLGVSPDGLTLWNGFQTLSATAFQYSNADVSDYTMILSIETSRWQARSG